MTAASSSAKAPLAQTVDLPEEGLALGRPWDVRGCCLRLLLILLGSAHRVVNEVSVSQQLARRDRHFLRAATTPNAPAPPKRQPLSGQIYGLTPFLFKYLLTNTFRRGGLSVSPIETPSRLAVAFFPH